MTAQDPLEALRAMMEKDLRKAERKKAPEKSEEPPKVSQEQPIGKVLPKIAFEKPVYSFQNKGETHVLGKDIQPIEHKAEPSEVVLADYLIAAETYGLQIFELNGNFYANITQPLQLYTPEWGWRLTQPLTEELWDLLLQEHNG